MPADRRRWKSNRRLRVSVKFRADIQLPEVRQEGGNVMSMDNMDVYGSALTGRSPAAPAGEATVSNLQARTGDSGTAIVGNRSVIGFRARAEHDVLVRQPGRIALALKRAVDIAGALVGLVVFAPVMLVTAILIKLDDRGAVLFRQERVGKEGKHFLMLKFRTMGPDAESRKTELYAKNEMSGPVFKIRRDPRVTRVGYFLRKFSVDELPQFLHVLKGELSLVGPRPALPEEVAKYEPWQRKRLEITPGLTCLWQVSGRNELDFADWVRLDLEYVERRSLWLDTKILAKTIPTVLKGTGV